MTAAMGIESVEAKLHEARSFLEEMRNQEKKAFGDRGRFDHLLSAFLNAGRSVDNRLRHEFKATYPAWRKAWNAEHPSEDRILKSMHDKRDTDFHERGSGRIVKTKEIKVGIGSSYSDQSGTLEVWGSPSPLMGVDLGATISKPQYVFDVSGTERPVTEMCAEYLMLLEQMVAKYKADTSQ
jgi:hypothetical protein